MEPARVSGTIRPRSRHRPGLDDPRDRTLLSLAMSGDGRALDGLMEGHWGALVDYLTGLTGGRRDAAKDVAQEVFLRILERRLRWKPTGSARAFLFGVGRNLVLNQRKRRSVRLRAAERIRNLLAGWTRVPSPLALLEAEEVRVHLEGVLARLPERRREVFLLVRVHGFTYREVAELLDLSPQTVANHVTAALSDLRRLL